MYIHNSIALLIIGLQISACGTESASDRPPINTSFDLSAAPVSDVSVDEDILDSIDIPLTITDRPIDFTSSDAPDNDSIFGPDINDTTMPNSAPDTAPTVASQGDLSFVEITQFTDLLTRQLFIDFNERISAGEEFSSVEVECFNGYDSALGEPLVSLRCQELLQPQDRQIRLMHASFANTEACRSDLLIGKAENCAIAEALYYIEYSNGQVFASTSPSTDLDILLDEFLEDQTALASVEFGASDSNTLAVEFNVLQNSTDNVCHYALATGKLLDGEDREYCDSQAEQFIDELEKIEFHL